MNIHKNARLTLRGREELIDRTQQGAGLGATAAQLGGVAAHRRHADECGGTVSTFLGRAVRWFRQHGVRVRRVLPGRR